MTPELTYQNQSFVFKCSYDHRILAKEAGFSWENSAKHWYTQSPTNAAKLKKYATGSALARINSLFIRTDLITPEFSEAVNGVPLMAHQKDIAIPFALSRNRCYLGLDIGTGKSCVAAVCAAALKLPTIFITPPFLSRNIQAEFSKWAPKLKTLILGPSIDLKTDVLIIPDSQLSINESEILEIVQHFVDAGPALLIVDEAHRFAGDSKRTKALFGGKNHRGLISLFTRQIYLSGTPINNRAMELFPILSAVAPETIDFKSKFEYGRRYCAAHRNQFGWDMTGSSNMPELAAKVIHPSGPFMLRLRKEDVLDLPPLICEAFVISADMSPALKALDGDLGKKYTDVEDLIKERLKVIEGESELHIMRYRRLLGMEKIVPTAEYVKSILDDTDDNVLLFAHHKDVIKGLTKALEKYDPLVITGETPMAERQKLVELYRDCPASRLMIGNYLACGVGTNIQKANRVIFAEFDFVPTTNTQAIGRAYRMGQKNSVFAQFIVYAQSLDKRIVENLLRKQIIVDQM